MYSESKVYFYFLRAKASFTHRTILKKFIQSVFKKEGKKLGALNCIFCSDQDLLKINRKYLKHNFYTDIITFDFSENKVVQAEIYVSIDRVRENAQKFGVSFKSEFHRVIFHGVLHLCGYNDKSRAEKEKMIKKEDYYLKKYILGFSSST